jgi:hypothetical protein
MFKAIRAVTLPQRSIVIKVGLEIVLWYVLYINMAAYFQKERTSLNTFTVIASHIELLLLINGQQ